MIQRRSYLKRNSKPIPGRTAPRKSGRVSKKSEFVRCYHSKERVEFVKSLPCAACQVEGFSENAHVAPPSEKGMGYKASHTWIAPLCHTRGFYPVVGCHVLYDEYRWAFDKEHPDFNAEKAAAETERLWQQHTGRHDD